MVTLLGSPPNCAIFFCTHRKAITWSFRPLLPGIPASGRLRNPKCTKIWKCFGKTLSFSTILICVRRGLHFLSVCCDDLVGGFSCSVLVASAAIAPLMRSQRNLSDMYSNDRKQKSIIIGQYSVILYSQWLSSFSGFGWRRRPSGMEINCKYRVSQEECAILREIVPYVELYRYNPKHLYPKLNGYGDNGQRILKLWQLLHTYW